jgi:hypothetical protein
MPKMHEDDIIEGEIPEISQPKSPPFGATNTMSSSGFGNGSSFGASTNIFGTAPGVNTQQINQGHMNSTAGGSNAAQGADVLVANTNEDWINKKWRPVMGWVYMMTCTADFVVFPVLWSLLQSLSHGQVTSQWQPLTLQGAGLYHIAMGAVLGIAAYGRTKEKLESKQ